MKASIKIRARALIFTDAHNSDMISKSSNAAMMSYELASNLPLVNKVDNDEDQLSHILSLLNGSTSSEDRNACSTILTTRMEQTRTKKKLHSVVSDADIMHLAMRLTRVPQFKSVATSGGLSLRSLLSWTPITAGVSGQPNGYFIQTNPHF